MIIRRVEGNSMLPGYKPGQLLLARKARSGYKKGDVIIFKNGGLEKVKRVKSVRPDGVFVLGDNQNHSTDSRDFGLIRNDQVIGRVVRIKYLRREPRPGQS